MNNSLKKSLAGLTLIAIGVAAGWGLSQWRSSTHAVDGAAPQAGAAAERKVLYWYDPMSPTQKFDKPGKSPFMDMDLVPKYADEDAQDSVGLSVSAQTVQALGLRTAEVVQRAIGSDVDAVGTVLLNDRDVSIVQARSAGFVYRPASASSAGRALQPRFSQRDRPAGQSCPFRRCRRHPAR